MILADSSLVFEINQVVYVTNSLFSNAVQLLGFLHLPSMLRSNI